MTAGLKKDSLQVKVEESIRKTRVAKSDEGARAASVMQRAIEADPVLRNSLGQESGFRSRIGFFGAQGVLWAIGIIITEVGENGLNLNEYDMNQLLEALGLLWVAGGVLYARYVPGLKPLFYGWFGKE